MRYVQQGDVLLFACNEPKDCELIYNQGVLHQGLNHVHSIVGDHAMYKYGNDIYLRADSVCTLKHHEHGEFDIQPGWYKKSIVLEYDHWLEESREVKD